MRALSLSSVRLRDSVGSNFAGAYVQRMRFGRDVRPGESPIVAESLFPEGRRSCRCLGGCVRRIGPDFRYAGLAAGRHEAPFPGKAFGMGPYPDCAACAVNGRREDEKRFGTGCPHAVPCPACRLKREAVGNGIRLSEIIFFRVEVRTFVRNTRSAVSTEERGMSGCPMRRSAFAACGNTLRWLRAEFSMPFLSSKKIPSRRNALRQEGRGSGCHTVSQP